MVRLKKEFMFKELFNMYFPIIKKGVLGGSRICQVRLPNNAFGILCFVDSTWTTLTMMGKINWQLGATCLRLHLVYLHSSVYNMSPIGHVQCSCTWNFHLYTNGDISAIPFQVSWGTRLRRECGKSGNSAYIPWLIMGMFSWTWKLCRMTFYMDGGNILLGVFLKGNSQKMNNDTHSVKSWSSL